MGTSCNQILQPKCLHVSFFLLSLNQIDKKGDQNLQLLPEVSNLPAISSSEEASPWAYNQSRTLGPTSLLLAVEKWPLFFISYHSYPLEFFRVLEVRMVGNKKETFLMKKWPANWTLLVEKKESHFSDYLIDIFSNFARETPIFCLETSAVSFL